MATNQEHLIPEGRPKEWKMSDLEDFGRIRLSCNFFMRDMLYSEVASHHGIMNVPYDPVWPSKWEPSYVTSYSNPCTPSSATCRFALPSDRSP